MARFIEPFLERDSPRTIVGIKRMMGSCYTMTRVFRTVSLDFDWDPALDVQCDRRLCRFTQRNPKTSNLRSQPDRPGPEDSEQARQGRGD